MSKTPPVIRVSFAGLLLAAAIAVAAIAGDLLLPGWLGLDIDCLDRRGSSRAEFAELVICSAGAGPAGWLYLAWFVAPLALAGIWLRRALKRARRRTS